jgi:hypothetical protein
VPTKDIFKMCIIVETVTEFENVEDIAFGRYKLYWEPVNINFDGKWSIVEIFKDKWDVEIFKDNWDDEIVFRAEDHVLKHSLTENADRIKKLVKIGDLKNDTTRIQITHNANCRLSNK